MFTTIKLELQKNLSPKRYQHSLWVARKARELAQKVGETPERAELAGLLHDCAKDLTDEELLALAKRQVGYQLSAQEEAAPHYLLHAVVGSWFAGIKYGIVDPVVVQAIRRHTIGGPEPTVLDQILYIADFLDPKRDHEKKFLQNFQKTFKNQGLAAATCVVIKQKIKRLQASGKTPHLHTLQFLADLSSRSSRSQ